MNTFTNKVVVITGGNSGMGLAAAQEFSRRGAKVVISGRDEKTLAAAAASIGGETLAVRIFGLLHYGHNSQVNALCLLLLALAVAPLALWQALLSFTSPGPFMKGTPSSVGSSVHLE